MSRQAGIVYHDDYLLHGIDCHPERKERLEAVIRLLAKEGLLAELVTVEPQPASAEEIAAVHDPAYIDMIQKACSAGIRRLDADTYLNRHTYATALLAAGGGLKALDLVLQGEGPFFVLARPPGHHAVPGAGMGFCIFNNIALAAKIALSKYKLEKILIVDWDVHHGNGIESIFYDDPSVLYFSVHQSPAFPGTGDVRALGQGFGRGFNINCPLPPGLTDGDYARLFLEILLPVACRFKPQLILVSAGQDAHRRDPLAGMNLTLAAYRWMAGRLMELAAAYCPGRLLFFLEGGYNLQALAESVFVILDELTGFGSSLGREGLEEEADTAGGAKRIGALKELLAPYWF